MSQTILTPGFVFWDGRKYTLVPGSGASGSAGGDLSGTFPNPQIVKIQGINLPIPSGSNTVLTWSGTTLSWAAGGSSTITISGDVTGLNTSTTVARLQGLITLSGTPSNGQVLTATSGTAASWATPAAAPTFLSMTGDVVGNTNSNTLTLAGDVSGRAGVTVVGKINGTSVPASPTTGNGLHATSGTTATWSALNLAGGSNFVTGLLPIANQAAQTVGGDLSGSTVSASVVALRGEPIAVQTLGAAQDGYVLTFDFSDGYYRAAKSSGGGSTTVQNGSNYGKYLVVYPFPGQTNTNSTTFVTSGTFEFDPTAITAANGTRTITLRVVAETTSPLMTIQLYNLTAAAAVTGSTLTTSSTTPVTLTTGDLSANLSNSLATYQVQIEMAAGGTGADRVTLDMAILKVVWS